MPGRCLAMGCYDSLLIHYTSVPKNTLRKLELKHFPSLKAFPPEKKTYNLEAHHTHIHFWRAALTFCFPVSAKLYLTNAGVFLAQTVGWQVCLLLQRDKDCHYSKYGHVGGEVGMETAYINPKYTHWHMHTVIKSGSKQ